MIGTGKQKQKRKGFLWQQLCQVERGREKRGKRKEREGEREISGEKEEREKRQGEQEMER